MVAAITESTLLSRNEDLLVQPIDDDVVMADIASGTYFGLTGSGKAIWDLLATPTSVSAMCDALGDRFDVDRAECEQDTLAFVRELLAAGLVRVAA